MQAGKSYSCPAPARVGFTLVEMLVVISVVVALSAMTIPIVNMVRERGQRTQTRATVDAMTAAIAAAGSRSVTVMIGGELRTFRRFDVDNDGLLDPDPRDVALALPAAERAALIEQGYLGPVAELQPSIPKERIDATGQVTDAWGQPLRIARLAASDEDRLASLPAKGADAVALWSAGPDLTDDTEDDIRSWEAE